MEPVPLLRVKLAGKVVAEADLVVHDQSAAWTAFLHSYPAIAHLIAGEMFGTMHIACNDELRARTKETGIVLELEGS